MAEFEEEAERVSIHEDPELEKKAKQTQGRRKIAIRKIENKNKKHVTFSKRRRGLFKKASELCAMCGASVAVVTFSAAGKVFSFGHPSPDAVFNRYLYGLGDQEPLSVEDQSWWNRDVEELGFDELRAYAAAVEEMRSRVESRIADLEFDRAKAEMNDYFVPPGYLSLPPPGTSDQQIMWAYGGGAGFVDDGIARILTPNFNRFSPGFPHF